jgi:hypothetical protein
VLNAKDGATWSKNKEAVERGRVQNFLDSISTVIGVKV